MAGAMIACSGVSSIFVDAEGKVWGCGAGGNGQLGLGAKGSRTLVRIDVADVKQVACGYAHTIFLKNDGTVWGCGYNHYGQLGLGDTSDRLTLEQLKITNVKYVACGRYHTNFIKNDGTLWGCGRNSSGQLGLGNQVDRLTPVRINLNSVKQTACGQSHTVFLKTDGTAWGCGNNGFGQLGLGNASSPLNPVQLNAGSVKQVSCGINHTALLQTNGDVWTCGWNSYGQLGFSDKTDRSTFVKVSVSNAKQVACGGYHTMILTSSGSVLGYGKNDYGQLGSEAGGWAELSGVKQVACGENHTIFLKDDDTLWGCGYNVFGQLGLGDTINRVTPTQINTLLRMYALLYDAGVYKTISNKVLQVLDSQDITASSFERKGFVNLMDMADIMGQMSVDPILLRYQTLATEPGKIKISYLPEPQLIMPVADIDVSAYSSIKQITLATTGTTGDAKVIFSFDDGITWQTHANGAWAVIEPVVDAVAASGVTAADVAAIPPEAWSVVTGKLRVAYYLSKAAITDDLTIASLTITGDTASWELANHDDYQCSYPTTTTMQIKLLSDGSYKINYVEQK